MRSDRVLRRATPPRVYQPWLWWSKVDATDADVDRCRQVFLRRFDIEHTFRRLKQTPVWTAPQLREPIAAARWTSLSATTWDPSWAPARYLDDRAITRAPSPPNP